MALGPDARSAAQNAELIASQYPQLAYSRPANLIETLVEALRENQVLGMFKGRMEFGPRALCNRSIVYHPGDASANDWLNQRMERTEFMPFAPVTAVEHAEACYVGWREHQVAADYMTMTYDCHADFRARCPAVVHVDGTARPQIIRPQADPFMHALLHAWHARSGQPALINTSFNRHEEPIVCAPQDALGALEDGMVDLVVLGESLLVWRKGENAFARARFE
jgi:carbamoyltransferase